jgi:hypothetical protein
MQVERSRVRGIQVDAGDGNDTVYFLNFGGLLNLPVTVNGGAGDDDLCGENERNNVDHPIAFREYPSSYAKVVLNGGDGNDCLEARIGDTTLIDGAGDDQFVTASSWGHNAIVDDQLPPPPVPTVNPIDVRPGSAEDASPMIISPQEPATAVTVDPEPTPAAVVVAAVPSPTFSTTPLVEPAGSLFADHTADGVWE